MRTWSAEKAKEQNDADATAVGQSYYRSVAAMYIAIAIGLLCL